MKKKLLLSVLLLFFARISFCQKQLNKGPLETIPVAKVWSGHSVGFDLLTTDQYQYVAYYDEGQNMVIAQRPLSSK